MQRIMCRVNQQNLPSTYGPLFRNRKPICQHLFNEWKPSHLWEGLRKCGGDSDEMFHLPRTTNQRAFLKSKTPCVAHNYYGASTWTHSGGAAASCCGDPLLYRVEGGWRELMERWMELKTLGSIKRLQWRFTFQKKTPPILSTARAAME